MLFGITVTPTMMLLGGSALLTLVLFQFLQGRRIIHFKGKLHTKVHRAVAWLILVFALSHATVALAFLGFIEF